MPRRKVIKGRSRTGVNGAGRAGAPAIIALGLRIVAYLTGGWRTTAEIAAACGLEHVAGYRWVEYVRASGVPVQVREGNRGTRAATYHVTRADLARHLGLRRI